MAELKTKKNNASVEQHISSLEQPQQIEDCRVLLKIFADLTPDKPAMWGDAIIGYGHAVYRYSTGRTVEWFKAGFSPRKAYISIYAHNMDLNEKSKDLLKNLGKCKVGRGCINIKRLSDIDLGILRKIIKESF